MPIHDWTRVKACIFHDFHVGWIAELRKALNCGRLPADHYALAEQIAGDREPDVLTLQGPQNGVPMPIQSGHTVAVATTPPRVSFHARSEGPRYAAKAKAIVIRHASDHRIVAVIEIVSPGNKSGRQALSAFVAKADELLCAQIHLLIVDLFPPTTRDPQGIHKAIWDEVEDNDFMLPPSRPLTLASYVGYPMPEAFVEHTAVGSRLPDTALFLSRDHYVPLPLEATYMAAWEAVPEYWKNVIAATPAK